MDKTMIAVWGTAAGIAFVASGWVFWHDKQFGTFLLLAAIYARICMLTYRDDE